MNVRRRNIGVMNIPGENMFSRSILVTITLSLCLGLISCDEDEKDPDPQPVDAGAPYIYLYPEEEQEVTVTLVPKEGAWIIESDPAYVDGWTVWAEPGGRLNGSYDYLFYSARVFWEFQTSAGWSVEAEVVFPWFEGNLLSLGLSEDETKDFVEYWSSHLPYAPCYHIYPQYNDFVDEQVGIVIDPEPESILRLWLAIDRSDLCKTIAEPEPVVFDRNGFTVVEWGVVMRKVLDN
jgi:hypothetical protein